MIEELQRFLLVAQERNISRAAEQLFLTQSALTQSVQRLEKEVGTKLTSQKGKQLSLTPDGEALVLIATRILKLWHNAKDPKIRNAGTPTYNFGMFDNIAVKLRMYINENLTSADHNIELTISSSGKLLQQLQLGVLDLAICVISPNAKLPNNVVLLHTFTEKLIPVSGKRYKGNLGDIPFILYNQGSHTRAQIDAVFKRNNVIPHIYAESTSTTFMKELAIVGSGVAILPQNVVKEEVRFGGLTKIKTTIEWERTFGVLLNKDSSLTKESILVKSILKELKHFPQ